MPSDESRWDPAVPSAPHLAVKDNNQRQAVKDRMSMSDRGYRQQQYPSVHRTRQLQEEEDLEKRLAARRGKEPHYVHGDLDKSVRGTLYDFLHYNVRLYNKNKRNPWKYVIFAEER